MSESQFPKPVKLTQRSVGWVETKVEAFAAHAWRNAMCLAPQPRSGDAEADREKIPFNSQFDPTPSQPDHGFLAGNFI